MQAAAQRMVRRWGRRGPFLLFLGAGKVFFGVGMIVTPPAQTGLALLTNLAPLHYWALTWIIAGAVTFGSAFVRFGRDRWGFIAAQLPPTLWAFAYGWAAVTGIYPRGVWIFLWYITAHCGVIWCASRVPPEPRAGRPVLEAVEGRPR
ncbi:hypothetical protein [Actinacidiphila sp. ITFR-21]|uniref:hypothetical protein n=1 Tax=Actinacidiphila sp. ITFR-21 TaxID=3075199 RepID=UPI00288AE6E9|nr:hypothetical protein [Streptomyces sp. ITFR-21]WNI19184.1 hypothetical protein RLT57_29015 [Streptomyces sp. ITFR-21]